MESFHQESSARAASEYRPEESVGHPAGERLFPPLLGLLAGLTLGVVLWGVAILVWRLLAG